MKKVVGYSIDTELKKEYDEFIVTEFGHKRNNCSLEISKWIKLGLAINGNSKYQDDPDVIVLMNKVKEKSKTNIKSKSKNNTMEELIERKLDEKFAQFEKKTRREVSKKHGHAEFKKQFQMAFNDHHQVSRKDLEHFIMNHADIVDKRAVQNRIQYLQSHGMIQPFAPNVYNVNTVSYTHLTLPTTILV